MTVRRRPSLAGSPSPLLCPVPERRGAGTVGHRARIWDQSHVTDLGVQLGIPDSRRFPEAVRELPKSDTFGELVCTLNGASNAKGAAKPAAFPQLLSSTTLLPWNSVEPLATAPLWAGLAGGGKPRLLQWSKVLSSAPPVLPLALWRGASWNPNGSVPRAPPPVSLLTASVSYSK